MEDKGDKGVELQFEDGSISTADLVVGADGIRSVRFVLFHTYSVFICL